MIKKHFYEAPEAELLLVKFEDCILSTSDNFGNEDDNIFNNNNSNSYNPTRP